MGILSLSPTLYPGFVEHSNSWDALSRWIAGTDVEPSSVATQFGSGVGPGSFFLEEGNINRQIFNPGINPGATGADNVLAMFSLPANSFDILGRGISITASGQSGPTNATAKVFRLIFNPTTAVVGSTVGTGGTIIADSTGITTTAINTGWTMMANVFKYGAKGSNTQYAQCTGIIYGSTHGGLGGAGALGIPTFPTAVESGAILIAVTGNAGTAVADIVLNFFEINAMN
jgi:hypothetical protein